jgi:hypothetical protein
MMLNVALILLISFSISSPQAFAALEKPSLQEFCRKFKQNNKLAPEISGLFKESSGLEKNPDKALKPILKKNKRDQEQLLAYFDQSASFVRGEIEDEKTLSCTVERLQLSLLQIRALAFQKKWKEVQKIFQSWFLFAADFPYEESSLVGLRLTSVIRALLLDELENLQKTFATDIAKNPSIRIWFSSLRAPWPVDRVLVTEAKRLLKPPMVLVAQTAARSYQKNPYQTSAQALKRVKGGDLPDAALLKEVWKESDIQMMKTEMNRIGALKLRFAQSEYQLKTGKSAQSVSELQQAKLLDSVPMDYFTGQALGLTTP